MKELRVSSSWVLTEGSEPFTVFSVRIIPSKHGTLNPCQIGLFT